MSRRLKREWATYLASVDESGGAEGINASPDATMAVSNSIESSNVKLDVFLKDFIESLNESVEQSKKPGASKFSVEAVYGDCQSLLLDLVKATKRLVSVFKKQRTNKVKKNSGSKSGKKRRGNEGRSSNKAKGSDGKANGTATSTTYVNNSFF